MKYSVKIEFKPRYFWIGAYWETEETLQGWNLRTDVWICVIPCFPIHLTIIKYWIGK